MLFIWKLYQSHIFNNTDGQRVTFGSSGKSSFDQDRLEYDLNVCVGSLTSRVKALFWIAVGNFVFPGES